MAILIVNQEELSLTRSADDNDDNDYNNEDNDDNHNYNQDDYDHHDHNAGVRYDLQRPDDDSWNRHAPKANDFRIARGARADIEWIAVQGCRNQ